MKFRPSHKFVALASAAALVLAACGSDDAATENLGSDDDASASASVAETTTPESGDDTSSTAPSTESGDDAADIPDGPTIVIGAQQFGESSILAEVYGQALMAAGYPVEQQALGGFRDLVFTAFDSGDINFTAEYAASALEYLTDFAGVATGDAEETAGLLREELAALDLTGMAVSPAVDSNSFVVTPETAATLSAPKVSALTEDLRLGGPTDCVENAFCILGLKDVYGIDMSSNFVPLDGGGPLTVAALDGGEIDVAVLFSTNGVIADRGWIVLEDDKGMINADNIIPVTTNEVAEVYGEAFASLVDEISTTMTTEDLTEMNRRFDIDKEDADTVAIDWLTENGLLSSN